MNWRVEFTIVTAFVFKMWIITKRRLYHIFEIVFLPAISLISVGLMTKFLSISPDMIAFILVGVIALSVVHLGQLDISYFILYSIWEKSLKQEFAAPIEPFHLVLGTWLTGSIHSIIVFIALSLFSALAFDFPLFSIGIIPLFLFFIGLTLMSAIIGILVCSLAVIFGGRSHVVATSSVSILTLLSGIYYPVEVLPKSIQLISHALPLTHFLSYYRSFYNFTVNPSHSLMLGYFLGIVYLVIVLILFRFSLEYSKRHGIMTQISG